MIRKVLMSAVALVVIAGAAAKFWPYHAAVAKATISKRIDAILDGTDVKRAEIEAGIKNTHEAVDKLGEAKIKAGVQLEMLDTQLAASEGRVKLAEERLVALRGHIHAADTMPVSLGGRQYSRPALEKIAQTVLTSHKALTTEVDAMKRTRELLSRTVQSLEDRQEQAHGRLELLSGQLKQIDAEIVAVKALKNAAEVAGDGDRTLADNLEKLEKTVNTLDVDLKTTLRVEEEKWKLLTAGDMADVEKLITATKGPADTLDQIELALGKK